MKNWSYLVIAILSMVSLVCWAVGGLPTKDSGTWWTPLIYCFITCTYALQIYFIKRGEK